MIMNTKLLECYLAPKLEVHVTEVEYGFSISNMESIEDEKPEQDW